MILLPDAPTLYLSDSSFLCLETVTPDRARLLLTTSTDLKRGLNKEHIMLFAQMMREGVFKIAVNNPVRVVESVLANGRHRLFAVVESGVPTKMLVAYDV